MNVAEAFQPLYDQNAQHGIETGVSLCIDVPGVRNEYDHNEDMVFPAVGAAEIAVAHVLAQHCGPDWLQQKVLVPAADGKSTSGGTQKEQWVANRTLLRAMLSDEGDPQALQNLTLQAAALQVPIVAKEPLDVAPIDFQLDTPDQQYGSTTAALAEATAHAFGTSESSVVRRAASRAMTAEFPSFGVRNIFTSRMLHTRNKRVSISNLVVINKLGILDAEDSFVRSDTGYILDKNLVVSYAIFQRGPAAGDTAEAITSVAETSIQLMGGIIHNFVQAAMLPRD